MTEGINGPEVAHKLNQQDARNVATSASNVTTSASNVGTGVELKSEKPQQSVPVTTIYGPPSFKSMIPSESMQS